MCKLEGKVAIITGGTSGIGAATVELFIKEGAKVVFCGRNIEKGCYIEKKLNETFGNVCKYIKCDMHIESEIKNVVEKTIKYFGKIDVLINNAGKATASMDLEEINIDNWKDTFDINLNSYCLMIKYAKKYLLETKGNIINNASNSGLENCTLGNSYEYSISKSSIIKLTKMLAKNYAKYGIRVNCICPGFIKTDLLRRPPEVYAPNIPLGRVGYPEEVANLILFLSIEESSYITGAVIPIDGGKSLN